MKLIAAVAIIASVLVPTSANAAQLPSQATPSSDPKSANNGNETSSSPNSNVGDGFRVDSNAGDGTIGATVGRTGGGGGSGGPVSFTGNGAPPCTHQPARYGDYPNVVPPDANATPDANAQITRDNNGLAQTGWVRDCSGSESFYWAATAIDPIDLIPNALANARAQLTAPTPDINPDPTAGGIVNLGMWLAIDDPGTTTARATLAGVWAQVTADATSITIDLGNGDTISCDGLGTPIPAWALDEADQGPCGYTYAQSSPDDAPYQLTITTNYTIAYTTSTGANGTLAPITRSTTINYDVDEIQTIGVSN